MNILIDSLSVDEIESLLAKKNKKIKKSVPKPMTELEKWTRYYKGEVIKLGVLYPPTL
ncbi:MAG: hypothetical protein KDC74_10105 [Flavobacteriaceae bacterium]|nr:hypothetical protein [Flavobacteriaceae bacterium]